MSELKAIDDLYERKIRNGSDPYKIKLVDVRHPPVYLKSEADNVIAELKNEIEVQKRLRNMALASVPNALKVMKIIQHHKYKRCVAMARWCGNAYDKWMMKKANAIRLGKDGVEYYHQARWEVSHYMRWHVRWLKIAEQFKEAK